MAKPPKILEVTFGTFSCRLEGFEEPIEALMAVAEYLRDLAARDPDFGTRAGAPAPGVAAGASEPVATAAGGAHGGAVEPVMEPAPAGAPPAAGHIEEEGEEAAPLPDPELHPGLQKLLAAAPGEEEAVTRIMSQADDQLADPEAARRREVIARLRAAVAATEAERALGEPGLDPEARAGAFRLDLREAVREPPAPEGERPHPAPLRLVASQRVDLPEEAAREETQPAEPEPREETAASRQESFPAFAAEMGAGSLPDILEAAAAWLCFVEEAEDVSRGQLLGLAAEALPAPPDREEGLRAFGTLLRQGRIAASAGGRYRVSPGSRFNPGRLAG